LPVGGAAHYSRGVDRRLEAALNLLLESERAGVVALDALARDVEHDELRRFLIGARDEEQRTVDALRRLIRDAGGKPSEKTGPFAAKVAALSSIRERLDLMHRGQEWVARKVEEAIALAPAKGPVREFLQSMANRHRAEVEWGRAEVIRLLGADGA
jgi:nitronate monooxygenase